MLVAQHEERFAEESDDENFLRSVFRVPTEKEKQEIEPTLERDRKERAAFEADKADFAEEHDTEEDSQI